jgi:hypothetical protein
MKFLKDYLIDFVGSFFRSLKIVVSKPFMFLHEIYKWQATDVRNL